MHTRLLRSSPLLASSHPASERFLGPSLDAATVMTLSGGGRYSLLGGSAPVHNYCRVYHVPFPLLGYHVSSFQIECKVHSFLFPESFPVAVTKHALNNSINLKKVNPFSTPVYYILSFFQAHTTGLMSFRARVVFSQMSPPPGWPNIQ